MMENPLQAPHSGGSSCKGLVFTASFLSCWIQLTSAQSASVRVVPNPPYGTVGSSVILDILGSSKQLTSYLWFRNTVESPSPVVSFYNASSGEQKTEESRMEVFSNGSLFIADLTLGDTGDYIVLLLNPKSIPIRMAQGQLAVYETASRPTISASRTNFMENSTLVFTCNTKHEGMNILWFFNNAVLPLNERKNMSENNRTLTIKNMRREDAGSYQCEVWNPISASKSDPLTLTVNYGPDNVMFSPTPVRDEIQAILNNPLILVCQAESYPPAQYGWRVNGTVNANFSSNTYAINNVSWEDSGKYTCLAWNNITNITVSKDVTIRVVVDKYPGRGNGSSFSGGAMIGTVIGLAVGVTLIVTFIYFLFFRKTGRASKHHLSKKNHSASKHGDDTGLYENTVCLKGSAKSGQGLDSSPAFPEVPSESAYQATAPSRPAAAAGPSRAAPAAATTTRSYGLRRCCVPSQP
ncbi:carcinoembryonic antigen-related cell adhesion molecule 6-like [Petaurus breviceps papuanus]|uniref:carcinoembryonic antigen-related cell adhesion molecule 6-like n=1 Tax=Petaurus breviceps papuanus TaxID=3040969 RepID=UPI0036D84FA2